MEVEKININQSLLYRRVYRNGASIKRHIKKIMHDQYDTIFVFKFKDHYSYLEEVRYIIQFINSLFKVLAERKYVKEYPHPTIIRVLYGDWFMEICAALGALGGVSSFLMLIKELRENRGIVKKDRREEIREYPVQKGGKIQLKRKSHVYVEDVIEENLEGISIEAMLNYWDEELEYIEIWTKEGEIIRYLWKK